MRGLMSYRCGAQAAGALSLQQSKAQTKRMTEEEKNKVVRVKQTDQLEILQLLVPTTAAARRVPLRRHAIRPF